MSDVLLFDVEDGVATITMNRPEALNALNQELSEAMIKALEQSGGDLSVRAVVLTGTGRAFSSGADLAEAQKRIAEGGTLRPSEILRGRYHPIINTIVEMEKPVIGAINGVAAGVGASLAYACDYRIASDKARFIQAFINIGLVPDGGSNYFLPRLVGTTKATELALTGEPVGAEQALALGIVNRVVPDDALADEARALGARFAKGPTRAYALTKKALRFGATNELRSVLDFEAELQDQASLSADAAEGVVAFVQKRPPEFRGR